MKNQCLSTRTSSNSSVLNIVLVLARSSFYSGPLSDLSFKITIFQQFRKHANTFRFEGPKNVRQMTENIHGEAAAANAMALASLRDFDLFYISLSFINCVYFTLDFSLRGKVFDYFSKWKIAIIGPDEIRGKSAHGAAVVVRQSGSVSDASPENE